MNCDCAFCRNNLSFDLPIDLIEAVANDDLVIFAGAGISTENSNVFQYTLYEEIEEELMLLRKNKLDFPSLMSKYCKKNTNGRIKLLQKIKSRFDYCKQFSELYRIATRFHSELSSIYYIKSIITTNWDDYFEAMCNAVPFVTAEDFAFHALDERKVYKIHGSISNYGSLVATNEDYEKCYDQLNSGVIGSSLKITLATKTVVFIGYSFSDYDFNRIYQYLKTEMNDTLPHIYIVSLDNRIKEKFGNDNVTIINTDGTYFLSIIREHLEGNRYLFCKDNLDRIYEARDEISYYHSTVSDKMAELKDPQLIYCLFYQDGLKHAFDYLIYNSKSGKSFYPQRIFGAIDNYEKIRKRTLKSKVYPDVAYIDGYIEGLKLIVYDDFDLDDFLYWYVYGKGPVSKDDFESLSGNETVLHKAAHNLAVKIYDAKVKSGEGMVLHHQPFL